jgi:hypothetical protein
MKLQNKVCVGKRNIENESATKLRNGLFPKVPSSLVQAIRSDKNVKAQKTMRRKMKVGV